MYIQCRHSLITSTTLNTIPATFRCESKEDSAYTEEEQHIHFTNRGKVRQIKQHITCKSTNLTYMIECLKCKKQYIGETTGKRMLRKCFKEHRQATINPNHSNSTVAVPTRSPF